MQACRIPFAPTPWRRALLGGASAAALLPWAALANPSGGQVIAGDIAFASPDAQTLTISQNSPTAVINWQDFSIGAGETVVFNQLSAAAAVLNRVTGDVPSSILGQLSGNGRVFLINPRGILFGASANVDVGSLVASTLDLADDDFLQGRYLFAGDPASGEAIIQAGDIAVGDGGFVVLAAGQVENSGLIQARLGSVVLASGAALTLELGDGLVSYALDQGGSAELAGVRNLDSGVIDAAGGRVWLAARTAQSLLTTVVNNQGQIAARSIAESGGEIYLLADGGGLDSSGALDVSSDGNAATGGLLLAAGDTVNLRGTVAIGAGGQLQLAATRLRVGAGNDCPDAICETQLESQLRQGVEVQLAAADSLSIAALEDGRLDGRSTEAGTRGGSLALHAAGEGRAIGFDHTGDSIELDGSFLASTAEAYGGNIDIGSIHSGVSIGIDAGLYGRLDAGALQVHNQTGAAQLNLYAGEGLSLAAIDVEGHVGSLASEGYERLAGAQVLIGSTNGDIVVTGPLRVSGEIEQASVGDSTQVHGAELLVNAEFASIRLDGPVAVDGRIGSVQGFEELAVWGASIELDAGSGSAAIDGSLMLDGEIGGVTTLGSSALVQGASLRLASRLGDSRLGGMALIEGSVDSAQTGAFASISGSVLDLSSEFGNVQVLAPLTVDGQLGSAQAGQGSEFAGTQASFEAISSLGNEPTAIGSVHFAGDASFTGHIAEAQGGEASGAFGAFLLLHATADNRLDGKLSLDGRIDTVEAGDSSYLIGAFGTLLSDQGDIGLGAAEVIGVIGAAETGNYAQLTGAAFWLDTSGAQLDVDGAVLVDGRLDHIQSGLGLDANGSYLYLNSLFGRTRLGGPVSVLGTLQNLQAGSGQAVGSQLLTGTGFSEGYGTNLVFAGNLLQRGTLGDLRFTDTEASSTELGGVLLDAGSYSLSFADIQADNLFAYFDSDSVLGDSRLDIGGYAELFSPSVQPTLSGGSLDIHAGELFLSANTDFETLTATTQGDLTVFFAEVGASHLALAAGGTLQLEMASLAGDSVQLQGQALYSDADSSIDAGALDATASSTILFQGAVRVGSGLAEDLGDAELLRRLALASPELLPESPQPNAYFSAPTVGLAQLSLSGDYLHIRSDFLFLGSLEFAQAGGFVHLEPRLNLPLFAESVDANVLGDAASKIPLNRGRIQPNIGSLSSVLGELPRIGDDAQRAGSQLNFVVGEQLPSLSELILGSGLRDSTLVIGGSGYRASIQISDQLDVDVRPSNTHFVLATQAGILGSERILTDGQVVILDGTVFSDRDAFYGQAADEINSFYQNLGSDPSSADEDEDEATTEKDDSQEQACEAAT
ncbi:MAG: filamentous hemagglutinin N-terminal domain-containing protein [Stagnimonas sp.]|nr:filamentous hemagglutinin N-terminal domain-containing protein [Stagnimonas sp.]